MRGFSRLVSSVGYLAGPAVVGEGLADPAANPHVRVVVAGLQGLDHSRDPGRGRAVGDGVDHVAADPGIGIPGQLEQPRPHPVVVSPDVAGAQVSARELASPALPASGQLQQSVDSIPGGAPLAGRQPDPYLLSDLAPPSHRPDDSAGRVPGPRIIPSAGGASGSLTSPDHRRWPGRLGQPRAARSSGSRWDSVASQNQSAAGSARARAGHPGAEDPQRHADCPPTKAGSHQNNLAARHHGPSSPSAPGGRPGRGPLAGHAATGLAAT
jgi:hypothetical protein